MKTILVVDDQSKITRAADLRIVEISSYVIPCLHEQHRAVLFWMAPAKCLPDHLIQSTAWTGSGFERRISQSKWVQKEIRQDEDMENQMKHSLFAERHPYRFVIILESVVIFVYLLAGTTAYFLNLPIWGSTASRTLD